MSSDRDPAISIARAARELQVGWWLFALVVLAVIGLVAWVYLAWIVFGLFVYYVARPIERRVATRITSRNLSAAVTLLAVVLPVVVILGAAILVALVEVSRFLTGDLVTVVERFAPVAAGALPDDPTAIVGSVLETLREGTVQTVFASVTRTVGSVAATLFNGFLSLLFAFFLLREDDRLAAWFRENVADESTDTHRYLVAVDGGLQSVYFGYTATIFIVMIMATVTYSVFNLIAPAGMAIPQPITLAVLTGLFTIVPLVGRSILYVVVTTYLVLIAVRTDPTTLWFPLVFFVVMELPFDNLVRVYIRPRLSGRLFPMGLIVFAYLIGPPLFGWYGIFYGPLLLVVVVLFLRLKLPAMLHPEAGMPETAVDDPLGEGPDDVGRRPSGPTPAEESADTDPSD